MILDIPNRLLVGAVFVFAGLASLRALELHPDAHDDFVFEPIVAEEIGVISLYTEGIVVRMARPREVRPEELATMQDAEHPWLVTGPTEARGPADVERVERLLQAWARPVTSDARVLVNPRTEELAPLGLQREDTLHLHLEREDDDEIVSIEVGMPAPGGGRYVRLEGIGPVFIAELPGLEYITPFAQAWRRQEASDEAVAAVSSWGFEGRERYAFERVDGTWTVVEPPGLQADPAWIDTLLGQVLLVPSWPGLDRLTAAELEPEALTMGTVSVWVEGEEGRTEMELSQHRDNLAYSWGRVNGGDPRTGTSRLAHRLQVEPHMFGRTRLLEFEPMGPATIRVSQPEGTMTLARDDAGTWTREGGHPLRPAELANLLWTLRDLRVADGTDVADAPPAPNAWELAVEEGGATTTVRFDPLAQESGLHRAQVGDRQVWLEPNVVGVWLGVWVE